MTVRRGMGLLVVSLITFIVGAVVAQVEPTPSIQVVVIVLGGLTVLSFLAGLVTTAWALLRPQQR